MVDIDKVWFFLVFCVALIDIYGIHQRPQFGLLFENDVLKINKLQLLQLTEMEHL